MSSSSRGSSSKTTKKSPSKSSSTASSKKSPSAPSRSAQKEILSAEGRSVSPEAEREGLFKNLPEPKFTPAKIKDMYRQMLLIRRFEERTAQQYQMQKIRGFCHLYIGQEAVAVGSVAAIEDRDYIYTTYRDHAHALIRGCTPRSVMAELFGKATGCTKGKGGSMHLYAVESRFMGGNGIVAGHVPVATGTAFKSQYNKSGEVTLCYFGDSVVNQGVYHESLNMASLWNCPIVYICENNLYGMGTAVHRASAEDRLYLRSEGAYRIPGVRCNGMDAVEMYKVTKAAVELARNEGRPVFIEAITYRYRGHSMSDPATAYRNKDEVTRWRTLDPLESFAAQFPEVLTKDYIEELEVEIKEVVADSIKFAEESPLPDPAELYTDVYIDYPGYPK
jgi:pyruvate dehydrogenase E1 component alpha subunit